MQKKLESKYKFSIGQNWFENVVGANVSVSRYQHHPAVRFHGDLAGNWKPTKRLSW